MLLYRWWQQISVFIVLVVDDTVESSSSEDEMIGPSVELAAPADAQYNAAEEFAARYESLQAEKQRIEVSGLADL